jgi:uncharacterized protein
MPDYPSAAHRLRLAISAEVGGSMTAQTEDSRALVGKFVDAFDDQRVDDALRLLHDEFLVHAAGDVPYSGDYSSPSGFLELITKMSEALELSPSPDMLFLADNDKVVLHYRLTFTARVRRKCRDEHG